MLRSLLFELLADEQLKQFRFTSDFPSGTTPEELELLAKADGRVTLFYFDGPLSFGAATDLGHQVRERTKDKSSAIILDFSRVTFIDVSANRAVETIITDATAAGKTVCETWMSDSMREILIGLNEEDNFHVITSHRTRLDALRDAVDLCLATDPMTNGLIEPATGSTA